MPIVYQSLLILISILSIYHQYFVYMEDKAIFTLNIDLQDGFNDDTVILEINNKEVFKEEKITSNPTIALAKKFTTNISSGEVNLKVNITTKNLVDNYKFTIDSETNLGISIMEPKSPNKKIEFSLSKEPFTYF